jgi:hypothetical protein
MEILKKYIGSMQWSPLLSKWIAIERGKEDFYAKIGLLHIFEKRKPKLIKDAKIREELNFNNDSDSDRTDNSESSSLSI